MSDQLQGDLGVQMESLRADLNQLRSDMKEMVQLLVETGKSEAVDLKDRMESQIRQTASTAKYKGKMAADRLENTIEENPMSSVLAALGIGFLIGLMTSR